MYDVALELVRLAEARKAKDNIAVICIAFDKGKHEPPPPEATFVESVQSAFYSLFPGDEAAKAEEDKQPGEKHEAEKGKSEGEPKKKTEEEVPNVIAKAPQQDELDMIDAEEIEV